MSKLGIKIHFGSLKTTSWWEHAIRFVFGGAITVIAGLLAKKYGPAFGGLFLAFPAIFPASATMLERHERIEKQEKGVNPGNRGCDAAALDARGAAMGSLALMIFAVFVWLLLPGTSGWMIIGAGALWLVAAAGFWMVRKYRRRIFGILSTSKQAKPSVLQ
ncbi:MAG TPA: DUF3147 family protein [Terriglobales bacterium]|nr:DUF3147 family protein [Terriglobales bacterium]